MQRLTGRSSRRQHWPWLRHFHGQYWYPPPYRAPAPLTFGVRLLLSANVWHWLFMEQVFVPPAEFFELLSHDNKFCCALGKSILAASVLESKIHTYMRKRDIKGIRKTATLGQLVVSFKENNLLTANGIIHFDSLAMKRNYLAHNLFHLFSDSPHDAPLPSQSLPPEEVSYFIERAEELAADLMHFSKLVEKADPTAKILL
jgi:hypothetical protein